MRISCAPPGERSCGGVFGRWGFGGAYVEQVPRRARPDCRNWIMSGRRVRSWAGFPLRLREGDGGTSRPGYNGRAQPACEWNASRSRSRLRPVQGSSFGLRDSFAPPKTFRPFVSLGSNMIIGGPKGDSDSTALRPPSGRAAPLRSRPPRRRTILPIPQTCRLELRVWPKPRVRATESGRGRYRR